MIFNFRNDKRNSIRMRNYSHSNKILLQAKRLNKCQKIIDNQTLKTSVAAKRFNYTGIIII